MSADAAAGAARHYAQPGLAARLLAAIGPGPLDPAELAPVDEFHVGGRAATLAVADRLGFADGARLLDAGCGLGGASRLFAARGAHVVGLDVTEDYVRAARALARVTGLEPAARYAVGSVLAPPFADQAFDGAYMLHVGMNLPDKAAAFAAVRRLLAPGARFAVYDVTLAGDRDALVLPLPWAREPAANFIAPAEVYRAALTQAGFDRVEEAHLGALARPPSGTGPPPGGLGLQMVMGADAPQRLANMAAALRAGVVAPIAFFARAA